MDAITQIYTVWIFSVVCSEYMTPRQTLSARREEKRVLGVFYFCKFVFKTRQALISFMLHFTRLSINIFARIYRGWGGGGGVDGGWPQFDIKSGLIASTKLTWTAPYSVTCATQTVPVWQVSAVHAGWGWIAPNCFPLKTSCLLSEHFLHTHGNKICLPKLYLSADYIDFDTSYTYIKPAWCRRISAGTG